MIGSPVSRWFGFFSAARPARRRAADGLFVVDEGEGAVHGRISSFFNRWRMSAASACPPRYWLPASPGGGSGSTSAHEPSSPPTRTPAPVCPVRASDPSRPENGAPPVATVHCVVHSSRIIQAFLPRPPPPLRSPRPHAVLTLHRTDRPLPAEAKRNGARDPPALRRAAACESLRSSRDVRAIRGKPGGNPPPAKACETVQTRLASSRAGSLRTWSPFLRPSASPERRAYANPARRRSPPPSWP